MTAETGGSPASSTDAPERSGGPAAIRARIRDTGERWWAAVRSAGPARLTYEIGLALLLTGMSFLASLLVNVAPPWLEAIGALSMVILTPLRLVYPAGALAAGAVVGTATGGQDSIAMLALAAGAGYRMKHLGRTVAAFAVALAGWLVALWFWEELRDPLGIALMIGLFLLNGVLPAVVGRVIARRRTVVSSMHGRNLELHQQQITIAREARSRERTRIARDMHDSLGHQLTLISMYAGALESVPEAQRAETIAQLHTTAKVTMAELRQILGVLHQEEDPDAPGAVRSLASLDDLAVAARAAGAHVTVNRGGDPRPLPPLIEHAAYRVIQEGVTNALRHARGGPVALTLRYESDALIAEVTNGYGRPHDRSTSKLGLIGLDERVRLAGGILYCGPTPDSGFRIAAMLPYQAPPLATENDAGVGPVRAGPTSAAVSAPNAAGDFADVIRRATTRSKIWLLALVVGVALMLAVCGGAFLLFRQIGSATVSRDTYDAVRIGQAEAEIRAQLPDPANAADDAQGGGPAPAGATCVAYFADLSLRMLSEGSDFHVFRFCFRGGALVAKDSFVDRSSG